MRILAISGSARRHSTNTALLRAVAAAAPEGVEVTVFDGVGRLPVFSPDLDGDPPAEVRAYIGFVEASDGVILSSLTSILANVPLVRGMMHASAVAKKINRVLMLTALAGLAGMGLNALLAWFAPGWFGAL